MLANQLHIGLVHTGITIRLENIRAQLPTMRSKNDIGATVITHDHTCVWIPTHMMEELCLDLRAEARNTKPRIDLCRWDHDRSWNWGEDLGVCTRLSGYPKPLHMIHAIWAMDILCRSQIALEDINRTRGNRAFVTLQFIVQGAYARQYIATATLDSDPDVYAPVVIPLNYGIRPQDVPKKLNHWNFTIRRADRQTAGGPMEQGQEHGFMPTAFVPLEHLEPIRPIE